MSQSTGDTQALQHVAEALRQYATATLGHFDQTAQAWRALPDHWHGRAAEQAREELRRWINQVEESSNMAKFLSQRVLQAQACWEQAALEERNRV